jgi:hypothetical protein
METDQCPLWVVSGHDTDEPLCPLMTQSGHRFGGGHFSLHVSITDNRSHGTSAVPEGYLVSHLANELQKKGRAGGVVMPQRPRLTAVCFCEVCK